MSSTKGPGDAGHTGKGEVSGEAEARMHLDAGARLAAAAPFERIVAAVVPREDLRTSWAARSITSVTITTPARSAHRHGVQHTGLLCCGRAAAWQLDPDGDHGSGEQDGLAEGEDPLRLAHAEIIVARLAAANLAQCQPGEDGNRDQQDAAHHLAQDGEGAGLDRHPEIGTSQKKIMDEGREDRPLSSQFLWCEQCV